MSNHQEAIPDDEQEGLSVTQSQCISCIHRDSENPLVCKAFPNGIPMVIFGNNFDHRFYYPGDNGIRWFPRNATSVNPLGPESIFSND